MLEPGLHLIYKNGGVYSYSLSLPKERAQLYINLEVIGEILCFMAKIVIYRQNCITYSSHIKMMICSV